jgi:Domain of unknown function (DUF4886)
MRIKRFFLTLILLLVSTSCSFAGSCSDNPNCTRVLFIGNSYTYVNDLPTMFRELAKSGNHRVETDMSAQGGLMLSDQVKSTDALDKIKASKWNFIVLQEQSQVPASKQLRSTQMFPAARTLVSQIREVGAEPIFFITWAHRDGWAEAGLPSYDSMQQQLNAGYLTIARELNVQMAPVGFAWSDAWHQNPQLKLWQDDGSHPTSIGTYLAACVFYATIFQESPVGLSYHGDLTDEQAQFLQKVVADRVLTNPTQWNIP